MKKKNTVDTHFFYLLAGVILFIAPWSPCYALEQAAVATRSSEGGSADGPGDQQPDNLPPELAGKIMLSLKMEKAEAYPDETIGLSIKLSYHNLSLQDIQYPQFPRSGLSVGVFGDPVQNAEMINGSEYKTLEFKTSVSGRKTGHFRLGPAQLQFSLLLPSRDAADAFFGGRKTSVVKVSSGEISLQINPFPAAGRPADFSGAVGNFDLAAEVRPNSVSTNDPLSLMTAVKGKGSFSAAKCPGMPANSGFSIHEPVASRKDGEMSCEQVIIPLTDAVREIPAITFSYFDPQTSAYHTLRKGPFPIKVMVSSVVNRAGDHKEKNDTGARPRAEKFRERIDILLKNPVVLMRYLLLSVCITLLLILPYRQRKKIRGYINDYQTRLRAKKKAKKGIRDAREIINELNSLEFYTIIFRTLQEYLGYLFKAPPAGITAGNLCTSDLPGGFDPDLAEKIRTVFEECDRARYALTEFDRAQREEVLSLIINIFHNLHITAGISGIVMRWFCHRSKPVL